MSILRDKNLYYVGGVVRDEIIGAENFDTDLCYEGNAIDFAIANFGSNVIKINQDFGTVRVLLDGNETDIASTRTEIYPKNGHLPKIIKTGCKIEEDLKRRDFTINAMAKNTVTNEIIDLHDGINDIKNKKLRVLHNKSFIEDPSRIIRGLKFSVRFNFELDEHTKKLQNEYLSNINYDMSYHRLKKELIETFNTDNKKYYKKFIDENIYKLLGENQPVLQNTFENNKNNIPADKIWIKYLYKFNLENFELTKAEKRIIKQLISD